MAAPVATARTLNGVQDTPIDSDDVPYYRAKTGQILPFGFGGILNASVSFVSRATRGDIDPAGFPPQGIFVGAFVKQAIRGDVDPFGFVGALTQVLWLTFTPVTIDRTVAFPQYINNIRSAHLVDPGNVVTTVELVNGVYV